MIIESMTHRYYVICRERESETYDIYRCRELNEAAHEAYLVYCVKETELIKALAHAFTGEGNFENFEEYYECFSARGGLCLVFCHYDQTTLAQKLQGEDCFLTERIAIGKRLLQRLLILDMPDFLMSEVMSVDHILVDASLSIHFRYQLEGILLPGEQRTEKIYKGLADIFTALFARELALEKCSEIPVFIQELMSGEHDRGEQGLLWVYQEYEALEELLAKASGSGYIRPNTFWFRVWDKIKLVFPVAKKIIFCLIVAVLAGYLIYGIVFPQYTRECLKFDTIGTLSIIEDTETIKNIETMETIKTTEQ